MPRYEDAGSDGIIKRYDILKISNKFPQLNKLKNRDLFLKGQLLGWSGVVWNEDLDVAAETVYEDGVDVTNEYSGIEHFVFGYCVKKARLELGLSQKELAKRIGVTQSDLSKLEKGLANPCLKMMKRVANALETKLDFENIFA